MFGKEAPKPRSLESALLLWITEAGGSGMNASKVVSHEEWVEACKRFLEEENTLTGQRDGPNKARRSRKAPAQGLNFGH